MRNNVQRRLPQNQRAALADNNAIKNLNNFLYGFQFRIIDYVRNANDAQEAIGRASVVRTRIAVLWRELLNENRAAAAARAAAVETDPGSTAAQKAEARQIADEATAEFVAFTSQRCQPPHVWDPITETCV